MSSLDSSAQQDFHALYREHSGWLRAWLGRKLGNACDAADLTHDTFIRVLMKQELAAIREPRAYLTTVAHGLMVNHLRRRELERRYLEALATLPEPEAPSPETQAVMLETLLALDAILDGLPARVRTAFLLVQLEGLGHADIAARLGVSVSSVRQYVARAMTHCLLLK